MVQNVSFFSCDVQTMHIKIIMSYDFLNVEINIFINNQVIIRIYTWCSEGKRNGSHFQNHKPEIWLQ